jgi:NAD(P)-dependent dehydrogenase (short-subunit alcohol dehydrogenase family)
MKHIIVTGTSRGIGHELALQFAQAGQQVLALSRTISPSLLGHDRITNLAVDITQPADLDLVAQFLKTSWTQVDALIHNAGAILVEPFATTAPADFESIYRVNVFAVAQLTQCVLPYLTKGSHVVTISSMGGIQGSMKFPGLAAYTSSKAAVIGLSELLAEEYKEAGIAFNVLAIGAVQTEMLATAFPGYQAPLQPQQMAEYIAQFALTGHTFYNGKVLQVSSTTP